VTVDAAPHPTPTARPHRLGGLLLPRGHALSEEVWRTRHRWVTTVLALHLPLLLVWCGVRHAAPVQLLLVLVPTALLLLATSGAPGGRRRWVPRLSRTLSACAASAGLMSCSAILVGLSGGYVEAHFHFFVMVPVIALYEAWAPFAVGVALVLLEHGLVGTLWPMAVFGHSMADGHPWRFAGIHAGFFAAACTGSLVTWRLAEAARLQQERLLAELHHRAHHDALTGLPNRAALAAALDAALRDAPGGALAVAVMDLDRFKEVNDTLGHTSGDELLRRLGPRLADAVRPGDVLVRLGGDEFAAVLPGAGTTAALAVGERLRRAVAGALEVDGVQVDVDVSVGLAVHSGAGARAHAGAASRAEVADRLLRQADVAMYAAKDSGSGVEVYDVAQDQHSTSRLSTLADLRRAIDRDDELVLHYQPKVRLADGAVRGVEGLIRWHHPARGLLAPAEFVPLLDATALAEPFTLKVVDLALGQMARWAQDGIHVQVAVNVPPRCLVRPGFVTGLAALIHRHAADPSLLRLEITENALLVDPQAAADLLAQVRALGLSVSIDDFGTGYSSLSYLRSLPIDELKIDRSFVMGLASKDPVARRADELLVRTMVELGHGLGLSVVAEGIEDDAVRAAVLALGCDVAQGYWFSRPVPAGELDPGALPGAPAVRAAPV
jgi:diguanylate cyclase